MTAQGIWNAVLERAHQAIPLPTVQLWLLPLAPKAIEENRLVVEASDQLFGWVSKRYAKALGEFVRAVSDLDGIDLRRAEES